LNKAEQILELIEPFVKEGKILPRAYDQIVDNIDDFILLHNSGKLVACAGLKDCKEGKMGEIYAAKLLDEIMQKARISNFSKIFALTKYNTQWFFKYGFVQMKIDELPIKRQALFNHQRNSSIFFKDVN